jgi:hypothetical protein
MYVRPRIDGRARGATTTQSIVSDEPVSSSHKE